MVGKNHSFVSEWTIYDTHTEGHTSPTTAQLAFLWIWAGCLLLYLTGIFRGNKGKGGRRDTQQQDNESGKVDSAPGTESKPVDQPDDAATAAAAKRFSAVKAPPTFNEFLLYIIQLGVIMLFFYYSDYVKVFPRGERVYSRDTFLFVVFLLFLVGTVFTTRPTADKILNRDQTEEWKGWMQVMFVWYHYFMAAEWYNWIRVYIAAYVWMTGFGNFSFFWIRKDFSFWRALKMLFRLNFLVLVICGAVSNPFMLYYICPMHTYWFLSTYAFMGILPSWNEHRLKMLVKFAVYAIANAIVFEIPGFTELIFKPLWPVLGFQIGKFTIMHEWSFRLGLDHWACFIGMVCAYNYPYFEAFVARIEKNGRLREIQWKVAISLPVLVAFLLWHGYVLVPMDKFTYNHHHPYLSFIPILCFIWFRNLFPMLRCHYIHLFAELGKITLETYLSQLHVYLQSNAKELVTYIVGYPLLNFSLNTIIYLSISHALFSLTSDISAYLLPKDTKVLRWRLLMALVSITLAFGLGFVSSNSLGAIVTYL